MLEPPRRRRFQIHLSTAVVLMFVAGGSMWANLVPRTTPIIAVDPDGIRHSLIASFYGWPYSISITHFDWFLLRHLWWMIAVDLMIFIGALFFTYLIVEWLIRRRAARKGA